MSKAVVLVKILVFFLVFKNSATAENNVEQHHKNSFQRINATNISTTIASEIKCLQDIDTYFEALMNKESWALKS